MIRSWSHSHLFLFSRTVETIVAAVVAELNMSILNQGKMRTATRLAEAVGGGVRAEDVLHIVKRE
jgi:hypothetical protein